MDINQQYSTIVKDFPFDFKQYKTPHIYQDPIRQIIQRQNMNYKKKLSQGKFKPSKRKKVFYLQQTIQPLKNNPSPDKYKTALNSFQNTIKKPSQKNNKLNPNVTKNTYIDQIQKQQIKNKVPGIGKYDLLTLTDFTDKHAKKLKSKNNPQKISAMDNIKELAAKVPGPGQYNPHLYVKKINLNRTDFKFYQQKFKQDQIKLKRSKSARLSPCTYNPVHYNTFDSIKRSSPQPSRWSHGQIQIRKGVKSAIKYPGPAQYKLINQWSPTKSTEKKNQIGELNLFGRTIKSARSLSIYRD